MLSIPQEVITIKINGKETAVVVLNYMTYLETQEFLESFRNLYKNMKVYIVDNGSPETVQKKLQSISKKYRSELIILKKNLGFAKGNNVGIKKALNEGYKIVACSNNDIIFKEPVFEILIEHFEKNKVAVVGPRIISKISENDQNPLIIERPSMLKAKKILRSHSLVRYVTIKLLRTVLNDKQYNNVKNFIKNQLLKSERNNKINTQKFLKPQEVYALHGAFLIFGPEFFKHYNGFDEHTFLYGEELILAEMLYKKGLKAIYDPRVSVIHKEDRTSNIVFGGQDKFRPFLYARKSIRYWYKNWYRREL